MKKETYKIYDMHCASCVRTIEGVLMKTKGVSSASVNFANESAQIEFDEKVVSPKELAEAVGTAGYRLGVESEDNNSTGNTQHTEDNEEVSLKVIGMSSPHCAGVVEKAIKGLPGIKDVDIDFSNSRAKVAFNPKELGLEKILAVIT
ncbi:MAG TPA: hypothetical protein ENI56_00020, partial [Candidatus Kaiserbacteria bacterium]|nr:hypothetical protein [Candidatus Kaiserbacteria bacterium]